MFQDKLDIDLREPILHIPLPSSWSSAWLKRISFVSVAAKKDMDVDVEVAAIGLILPRFEFWKQLGVLFVIQTCIGMIIGWLVHVMIIQKREIVSFSTITLMGYGIFIPTILVIPIYLNQWLDTKNSVQMIIIGGSFSLQALRCISAMYGTTTPKAVEKKLFNYCIYFCSIVDLKYDSLTGEFVHVRDHYHRIHESLAKLKILIIGIIQLTLMFSVMEVLPSYKPFPDVDGSSNIVEWKHLVNNMSFAYMWHLCLLTGATTFQFAVGLLTGIQSTPLTRNPLFASASPTDFWGRRWNNVVHKVLKDNIYRPLIPHCHIAVAATAVFFVSGLLHEYVLFIGERGLSQNSNNALSTTTKPQIQYGVQTLFFLWNAIVLLGDYMIGNHPKIKSLAKSLPRVVVSLLVVMTVLPIVHLFSQGMMDILLLEHYKFGYPMFVPVKQYVA